MFSSAIYKKCPIFFQNVLISSRGWGRKILRENPFQTKILKRITCNEQSKQNLDEYCRLQIDRTIKNAVENVPFYSNFKYKTDISLFSLLTKSVLINKAKSFQSKKKPFFVVTGSTSGTTGTPLKIPQSMTSVIREQAFISRHLKWAGYEKGDKRAWIRGDLIVPIEQELAPFWRYSWFENMILLSSFHMHKDALDSYIKVMADFEVDIIQAYPSSIAILAKYLKSQDSFFPKKIKSIITSSEVLTLEDREVIEERFQCKVFDWYGLFERVAAIANCEYGKYHLLTDYSYIELIKDEQGRSEIVGTNYNNHYYPLIRYKTGDHVRLSEDQNCLCNRPFLIVDGIDGREVDYLFGEHKNKVFALDQCVKDVSGIVGAQYVQYELKEVTVNVITDDKFNDKQRNKLIQNVKTRLGPGMTITIKHVSKLERTKNGKVRQAICTIKEEI